MKRLTRRTRLPRPSAGEFYRVTGGPEGRWVTFDLDGPLNTEDNAWAAVTLLRCGYRVPGSGLVQLVRADTGEAGRVVFEWIS